MRSPIKIINIFMYLIVNLLNTQKSRLIIRRLISKFINASAPAWILKTHINHSDVANIGKAKNSFKVSIHWPGFGSAEISSGLTDSIKYGIQKPNPSDIKIGNVTKDGWINA